MWSLNTADDKATSSVTKMFRMTDADRYGLEWLLYGLAFGILITGLGALLVFSNFFVFMVIFVMSYGFYRFGQIYRNRNAFLDRVGRK